MNARKLLLLTGLTALPGLSLAQEGVFIGGFYEKITTDNKKETVAEYDYIDGGSGLGLELGFLFSPHWGIRLEWGRQDFERSSPLAEGGDENRFGLDLMYRFTEKNHLYTYAGLKSVTPGEGHAVANLGLGASLPVGSRWSLFVEGAFYEGLKENFRDFGAKAGIRYQLYNSEPSFVSPHKAVQTVVVSMEESDLDKDGVIDRLDLCPGTAEKQQINEEGCPIKEQTLASMQLNILFQNDSAELDPSYHEEIGKVADFMQNHPGSFVEIGGHTSSPGSSEYNQKLSQARAEAVANILVDNYGINAERITAKGYGESRLLDPTDSEAAHTENRRIEAVIYSVITRTLGHDDD